MSPASRSKSKDKPSTKVAKEHKALPKPVPPSTAVGGVGPHSNAYNPLSGTFHTLESPSSPPQTHNSSMHNPRFRTIEDPDDHSGTSSLCTGAEYEDHSTSSCSGESEDHQKDNSNKPNGPPSRPDAPPGSSNEKREKIRQKNERKHQRQRERRAQELHERCTGYLMSRRLEALSQQLVAMGFSHERATMALILNEGRVEESVAWLFEGSSEVESQEATKADGSRLKIDISEELARLSDMETRFGCSRQEVERAVVACEGDLDKAAETLRVQKPTPQLEPMPPQKPESTMESSKQAGQGHVQPAVSQSRSQQARVPAVSIQRRDERVDFNYTKTILPDPSARSSQPQPMRRVVQVKPPQEWSRAQVGSVEKKPVANGNNMGAWPSVSSGPPLPYSLATNPSKILQPTEPSKTNLAQALALKERVIVMQRPHPTNPKSHLAQSGGLAPAATAWTPSGMVGLEKSSGVSLNGLSANQGPVSGPFHQAQYQQPYTLSPVEPIGSSSWGTSGLGPTDQVGLDLGSQGGFNGWNSALGSSNPDSNGDWSMGSMGECDYTSIDWSMAGSPSFPQSLGSLGPFYRGSRSSSDWGSQLCDDISWSDWTKTGFRASVGLGPSGVQEVGGMGPPSAGASVEATREWTNPFAGKDLFSFPRPFLSSPSL
ncbi:hypothetical protein AMTRI_Chr01g128490 [Amborella trichopoda]|uniref:UBA domain-containing protein n=1 Tax=Amborella trichopoda TaxID=13333 RepID=U5D2M4_AMBTC|nr:uncharacterized protein LOC18442849 [Amborella trichopoda]XP_011626503.1 uncharacterized protein LOC18442849 [Amborella trichopoda]XP_011626504.1 uncharacterized protein LOC18442849 [Amborella trichopoda]XP_020528363.1 uncharacterized protein LOC18442849 [Amborella trichopoda]ERN14588.1 hypothetical protein AMTR_s00038p00143790 [Amborella trichopoda]|eukprot:XP_006853121.1 uncharacterized protein LOC18442849 [Amborella trichopoda]